MSADNGIYIARFKCGHPIETCKDDGFEYRVTHAQAIENCELDPEKYSKELIDAYRVSYFGRSEVYFTREDAQKEAWRLHDEIMDDDFAVLEYGISEITFDVPFPTMTEEEAHKIMDADFESNNQGWPGLSDEPPFETSEGDPTND